MYRSGPDWCMTEPTHVDTSTVKVCNSDKEFRCPRCKRRVNMALYNYAPYATREEPKWCWPAHKIRKTKR